MRMIRYGLLTLLLLSSVVQADPIIIGLDADMSAVAAESGTAIQRGAELAINEINLAGGVLGRPLVLDVRDHRANPDRGLASVNYFASKDNVIAILGGVHSSVVLHELAAIHQTKMLYLVPWAASTNIIDNGFYPNYVFRLSVRDEQAAYILMEHAQAKGAKKVGLLLERTAWGRSNHKSMLLAANSLAISVVGVEWFNWREASMKIQIDKLLAAGVDAILMVANAPEGAVIIQDMAARELSQRRPIIAHWGIATGNFVQKTGIDTIASVDLSILQTASFLQPKNKENSERLLNLYQNTFDKTATAESIYGAVGVIQAYDLVHLLAIAITKAGTVDRSTVRLALEDIASYSGVLKTFTYPFTSKKHDALDYQDYMMAQYNEHGYLVPINDGGVNSER